MTIRCCPNCGTAMKPLKEMARAAGKSYGTVRNRLTSGMSLMEALTVRRKPIERRA